MSTKQRPVLKLPAIREQASSRHGSTRDVLTARDEHPSTHSSSMRKVLLTNLHKQRTVDLGACDGVLCAWAMIRAVLTSRDLCRQNLGRQPWCCSPSRFVHPPPHYRQRRQGAGGAVCGDVDRGRATPSVPQHGVLGQRRRPGIGVDAGSGAVCSAHGARRWSWWCGCRGGAEAGVAWLCAQPCAKRHQATRQCRWSCSCGRCGLPWLATAHAVWQHCQQGLLHQRRRQS